MLVTAMTAAAVSLLAYETYAVAADHETISEAIWAACRKRPYLLFFIGIECGHLFFCPCAIQ